MKKIGTIIILILISFILNANIKKEKSIKRFVMAIGANNGGPGRTKLQYALSDAAAFLKVLKEIGGVFNNDTIFLKNPTKRTFLENIIKLKKKVNNAKSKFQRVETIFYYSGHSDEKNILLGKEKIPYSLFHKKINRMSVDVKIAILDSCASGAFIRLKGGKYKNPFLVDAANNMKGYAIMTSSSSDEASQESDKIKGSYFTHNLISGLRGAADMSKDGKVTLNEVYQYAFNETLSQTESTLSGPQHPNYNIQMSGTGDVIMTDVKKSSALLLLSKELFGKIFIWDKNKKLVLELTKATGTNIFIALNKGVYKMINLRKNKVFVFETVLELKKTFSLTPDLFKCVNKEFTRSRGEVPFMIINKSKRISFFAGIESRSLYTIGSSSIGGMGYFGIKIKKGIYLGLFSLIPKDKKNYWGISLHYGLKILKNLGLDLGIKAGEVSGFKRSDMFLYENSEYQGYLRNENHITLELDIKLRLKIINNISLIGGISFPMATYKSYIHDLSIPSLNIGLRWEKW